MFLSALLLALSAAATSSEPPATRVEVLACRTHEGQLQCAADLHVDPRQPLLREGRPVFTVGFLARRTEGMFKGLDERRAYPVAKHALRRTIPLSLDALEDEALARPVTVKLALFRTSEGNGAAPAGAHVLVALSEEVSLDDLPTHAPWSPNPELYAGGDGSDCDEQAIVVLAEDTRSGQRAEYAYIRGRYPGGEVVEQAYSARGERHVDTFDLQLGDGTEASLCFDVTAFFGR